MRVVDEFEHPNCKITIFSWNNKYLIKLERGPIEQTFKISEFDVSGDEEIRSLIENETFMQKALLRFEEMMESLSEAMEKL
ncbi:hypothetical protein [Xanthovirga aplysinae]|uniref:hypothetical protein n=1 Tax=Xanthovirga aplysinae TaxID=2529853 RepID=UPI0012BCE890|nr:hypothetical protein [Xanthovirga aplysinae]MTI30521.1 hypothetical protein [Xanthovirga aplysinae]